MVSHTLGWLRREWSVEWRTLELNPLAEERSGGLPSVCPLEVAGQGTRRNVEPQEKRTD